MRTRTLYVFVLIYLKNVDHWYVYVTPIAKEVPVDIHWSEKTLKSNDPLSP